MVILNSLDHNSPSVMHLVTLAVVTPDLIESTGHHPARLDLARRLVFGRRSRGMGQLMEIVHSPKKKVSLRS